MPIFQHRKIQNPNKCSNDSQSFNVIENRKFNFWGDNILILSHWFWRIVIENHSIITRSKSSVLNKPKRKIHNAQQLDEERKWDQSINDNSEIIEICLIIMIVTNRLLNICLPFEVFGVFINGLLDKKKELKTCFILRRCHNNTSIELFFGIIRFRKLNSNENKML